MVILKIIAQQELPKSTARVTQLFSTSWSTLQHKLINSSARVLWNLRIF